MTTSSDLKEISQDLQKAFLSLQSSEECFAFLKDLMTEKEIKELSQRLDIAQRLHHKESYKYIYMPFYEFLLQLLQECENLFIQHKEDTGVC
ncbi:MAG: hypothetical protein LBP53_05545 [Candidatus Peribacteria bacterium]|jgi:hypothetical protein|nr:hypothetical protein [Candidatus Peribacteria bacterium]